MRAPILLAILILISTTGCKDRHKSATTAGKSQSKEERSTKLSDEVKRRLEGLRAAGLPVTQEELASWYAAESLTNNAESIYLAAFDHISTNATTRKFLPPNSLNLPAGNAAMTAAMKKDFSVVLHENAEAFRLLGKAAEMPDCRYSYDFKGFETLLPNAGRVGNASKLLQLKAYALVESGETAGAVRAILDNVALAKSLDRDLLIGHMTQLAFCHSCGDAAQRLLNRASPTSDQLKKLELAFKNLDSILDSMKGLKQCVVGERCGAIDLMTRPVADIKKLFAELGSTNLEGLDMDGYLQSAPFNEDFLMTLDIYENYEKAYGTPFPHNLEIYKNVEQLAGTAKDKQYYFTTMMIPALAGILDKQGVALARIRMARLAFAVEQHRLSNGGLLPEKLEQISPKLPDAELMDPFNGQSLHYQKEPRGYQISSVGVDGAGGVKRLAGADASNPNSPPSEAKSKPKTGAPAGSLLVFVVAK